MESFSVDWIRVIRENTTVKRIDTTIKRIGESCVLMSREPEESTHDALLMEQKLNC